MIKSANLMMCTRIIFVALMVLLPFSVSAELRQNILKLTCFVREEEAQKWRG